ncbi:MAG: TRAP transporter permease [Rhodospirillales bacterium]|nr:TRAP transporter permease [Rhodospirillales bacterium]
MAHQIDLKKAEELEAKFDSEVRFRPLAPPATWIVGGLLFLLSCFHFYTAGFGILAESLHRGIHLSFVVGLIFLVFALNRRSEASAGPPSRLAPGGVPLHDWAVALAVVVAAMYVPLTVWGLDIPWLGIRVFELSDRVGNPSVADVVFGTILLFAVLDATRRTMGWALVVIALAYVAFAMFGTHMPGVLKHAGTSWSHLIEHLTLGSNGFYGVPVGVVATYVFHFVLFGVLAMRIGLGQLFLDVAMAVAGRFAGGPAKVAIFGSALFGMISGSSVANAVTVGSLTIPMMNRLGYKRHFAAGVEATASTGGQITPPVMGAAAFLMVEYLSIPYQTIIVAAILPAFMHFFGVFVQTHFEAKKEGLRGLEPHELPDLRESLRRDWPTLIPLVGLLAVLLSGYTPYLAAFVGIFLCLVVGIVRSTRARLPLVETVVVAAWMGLLMLGRDRLPPDVVDWFGALMAGLMLVMFYALYRLNPARRLHWGELVDGFIVGAKYALAVGAAAACVGIIIGVVTLSGVGFKFAHVTVEAAKALACSGPVAAVAGVFGYAGCDGALVLLFTLMMVAVICIVMGCGIPTTSTYIIMVAVAAPALKMMGVPDLVSHFFVFYYGVLADITPPVAVAAYAAASMANADPFKTGNTAFRLALGKALVPFVFVYSPTLLLVVPGFSWGEFASTLFGCLVGVTMLSAAFSGYLLARMARWECWLMGLASLPVIAPSMTATLAGLAMATPVFIRQIVAWRRPAPA